MIDDFDIPELNRIDSMLDDLMPVATASSPAVSLKRAPGGATRRTPKKARFRRFAAHTLGQFRDGSNWSNATGFRSTLAGSSAGQHTRLGAVKFAAFGEAVNWKNALDGPQLILSTGPASPDSGPPETVDGFFDAMTWE
jgi:hypothetical protein